MKLVQFWKDGRAVLGIQTGQGVVDVPAEGARRGLEVPGTMLQVIAHAGKKLHENDNK